MKSKKSIIIIKIIPILFLIIFVGLCFLLYLYKKNIPEISDNNLQNFISIISISLATLGIISSQLNIILPKKYLTTIHKKTLFLIFIAIGAYSILLIIFSIIRYFFGNIFKQTNNDLMYRIILIILGILILILISYINMYIVNQSNFIKEIIKVKTYNKFIKLINFFQKKYKLIKCLSINEYVTIPQNIEIIGEKAFSYNNYIKTIEIHENCEIEPGAFCNCENLEEIIVYNKNYSFKNGILYKLNEENQKKEILFAKSSLDNLVVIDNNITKIHKFAFYKCKLSNIIFLPISHLEKIYEYAFYYCYNLKEIHFPFSINEISSNAFCGCVNLSDISFSKANQLKIIPEGLFYGCDKIKNISIPNGIEKIDDFAYWCDNSKCYIKKLTIPNSIKFIGKGVFGLYEKLTTIIFKKSSQLEEIDKIAFAGCYKIKEIYCDESIKKLIEKLELPKGCEIKDIEEYKPQ